MILRINSVHKNICHNKKGYYLDLKPAIVS